MRKSAKCNLINISLVIILCGAIVLIPNFLFDELGLLSNILLIPVALVASGYFVQNILSRNVNQAIYGDDLVDKTNNAKDNGRGNHGLPQ